MGSPHAAVNGPRRRKRTKYNPWQKSLLEKAYSVCKYPNVWTRETLSKALNVDDARIIVWFQNRRARYSRQTGGGRSCPHPTPVPDTPQTPSGTLHYSSAGPSQPPPLGGVRRPLAEVTQGPPVGPHRPVWHGPKPEVEPLAQPCALGQPLDTATILGHWAPPPPSPTHGPHPCYPLDEIELDFTIADFNMGLGLDLSQAL
ncbi:homeobox protein prophet of Pit-1-like isoform X2 [Pristis pectinata]|nr:homeobox protein prophet of Pit-1-like isoform X2 [Pristis pectinata]